MTILAADQNGRAARGHSEACDQRCRRTHHQIGFGNARRTGDDFFQFAD